MVDLGSVMAFSGNYADEFISRSDAVKDGIYPLSALHGVAHVVIVREHSTSLCGITAFDIFDWTHYVMQKGSE